MSSLLEKNKEIIEGNAFTKYNHMVISDMQEDYAEAYLDIVPETLNVFGNVHGGAYFTLADTCAAFAARSDGRTYVTQQANSYFVRPAKEGRITAEAKVVSRGRKICIIEVDIFDGRKKLVFHSTFNYFCVSE